MTAVLARAAAALDQRGREIDQRAAATRGLEGQPVALMQNHPCDWFYWYYMTLYLIAAFAFIFCPICGLLIYFMAWWFQMSYDIGCAEDAANGGCWWLMGRRRSGTFILQAHPSVQIPGEGF